MFKKASKIKLRFATTKGNVSTEDLWDMTLGQLDSVYKSLKKTVKNSNEESYIKKTNTTNKVLELKINIVTEIMDFKIEEKEKNVNAAETKAHNEKIMRIIAKKEDEELESSETSIEDLKKMLK